MSVPPEAHRGVMRELRDALETAQHNPDGQKPAFSVDDLVAFLKKP